MSPNTPQHVAAPPSQEGVRKPCACGCRPSGSTASAQGFGTLARKPLSEAPSGHALPASVPQALASPGQGLDARTRGLLEPRFQKDFSHVRIHSDPLAARSAAALGARAYTLGRDVVFGEGQYQPNSEDGLRLLTHELVHVVQQEHAPQGNDLRLGDPNAPEEREADRAAEGTGHPILSSSSTRQIRRALQVDRPTDPIPTPNPNGPTPTNAELVEGYLRQLSSEGNVTVDRATGRVAMDEAFCRTRGQRFLHEFGRGAARGAEIGAYFLGVGALPGLIIGGLVGLISGIASAASGPDRQASASSTPTGSTCLCDFVTGENLWTIEVNDADHPRTMNNQRVRVTSPYSPRIWGAATESGRLENMEPWLILGHELCGHAWLDEHTPPGELPEGAIIGQDARHHRTVERENLLRREHGLDPRGFRLTDPYCGESFYRDRATPQGQAQWDLLHNQANQDALRRMGREDEVDDTYLDECQRLRLQYLGDRARGRRVEERIP